MMGIVASFTREQWHATGGWDGLEPSVTGVVLLFQEDGDAAGDVMPQGIRIDTATGKPWPEDRNIPLPPIPYRYFVRQESRWVLEDEGADTMPHDQARIWLDRTVWYRTWEGREPPKVRRTRSVHVRRRRIRSIGKRVS